MANSSNWLYELAAAAEGALIGEPPDAARASAWLTPADSSQLGALLAAGSRVRAATSGDTVELCAIINAKNGRCGEDCAFCAQSVHHHAAVDDYPLVAAETIIQQARTAAARGVARFGIVTSGRHCPMGRELDEICRAVEVIAGEKTIRPCVSLGLLSAEQARSLRDAGVVRYHHNLEAGPSFYPAICTTHPLTARIETVRVARQAGMEVCVGGIVGLGESPFQRVELAQAIAELGPESVPLNFLNPIAGTRLGHLPHLRPPEVLAAIAVFKLFNPEAMVRTCGGRHQILAELSPLMYLAGASATMTGNYLTTEGCSAEHDRAGAAKLGLSVKGVF